jgi:hypothetical protein
MKQENCCVVEPARSEEKVTLSPASGPRKEGKAPTIIIAGPDRRRVLQPVIEKVESQRDAKISAADVQPLPIEIRLYSNCE